MFIEAVTILILICPYSANCQGKETCDSSLEMRKAALNKQLAAVDCENYHCGKLNLHKEHLEAEILIVLSTYSLIINNWKQLSLVLK